MLRLGIILHLGIIWYGTVCSQPSRPSGIGQDGDGRQESVRPRAGRRRRRLFEAGRRRTERTAVDGEVLAHITKIIRK
ncbi:hypothetical protein BDD12DRAFT_856357 [Trichophaea hybrida]|nr:hypothetical protein BDD12DRAFT_856357 [Trichophaea hybrida]